MKLLVLDGNSIVNRAFYGIRPLTTKDGVFTNGIYGFLTILLKLKEQVGPDAIVAAFDLRAPTFRHKLYDAYKAGRKGMPEELAMQMPLLKDLLPDMGVTVLEKEGYEADDLLGTLSRLCEKEGYDCILATGDRDSLQLVNHHTHVLLAATKQGQPVLTEYTPALIEEEKGIAPLQLIDVKALMGDSSDNIPGVAGVGEKTALTLIQTFGNLQGVYDNLQNPAIRPGVRAKLEADKENAFLSYRLGEIDCDVPVELTLNSLFEKKDNPSALSQKLASLELFKLIERLNLQPVPAETVPKSTGKSYVYYGETPALQPEDNEKVFVLNVDDKNYVVWKNGIYLCSEQTIDQIFNSSAILFTHDLKVWYNKGYHIQNPGFDTMLAAYLQNPSASDYSLNRLISEYAVSASIEGEIPQEAKEAVYCAACFEGLCEELNHRLTQDGQLPLLTQMEIPLAYVLAHMEQTGFLVDWEALQQYGEKLTVQIN
ncbi:MAG: DNA polymerase I, partial [Clostridia bacterium]|nr:DNA polymerase I [Clostridia bacterium]